MTSLANVGTTAATRLAAFLDAIAEPAKVAVICVALYQFLSL